MLRKNLMMIMTMRKRLTQSLMKLGEQRRNKVNYNKNGLGVSTLMLLTSLKTSQPYGFTAQFVRHWLVPWTYHTHLWQLTVVDVVQFTTHIRTEPRLGTLQTTFSSRRRHQVRVNVDPQYRDPSRLVAEPCFKKKAGEQGGTELNNSREKVTVLLK